MPLVSTKASPSAQKTLDERLERAKTFNQQHLDGVLRDFKTAKEHFDNTPKGNARAVRPFKLVITPAKIELMRADMSSVREDFDSPVCEKMILLRNLYRANCPENVRLDFNCGRVLRADSETDPEGLFMPTVSFSW